MPPIVPIVRVPACVPPGVQFKRSLASLFAISPIPYNTGRASPDVSELPIAILLDLPVQSMFVSVLLVPPLDGPNLRLLLDGVHAKLSVVSFKILFPSTNAKLLAILPLSVPTVTVDDSPLYSVSVNVLDPNVTLVTFMFLLVSRTTILLARSFVDASKFMVRPVDVL